MAKLQDIPKFKQPEIPKAVLEPEVQTEREVRRYIRKDGVFIKDLDRLFLVDTGVIKEGRIIYQKGMNIKEATSFVAELCEKSGRNIEIDALTERPKAAPGWNLNIQVPGMAQSEQKASLESDKSIQRRQQDQLVQDLRKRNVDLDARIKNMESIISGPKNVTREVMDSAKSPDTPADQGKGKGNKK